MGWHRVHHPVLPTECRLWIDAGFQIGRVRPRRESSMVLFHVWLGVARNLSQDQLARKQPPSLEELHEEFFVEYADLLPVDD